MIQKLYDKVKERKAHLMGGAILAGALAIVGTIADKLQSESPQRGLIECLKEHPRKTSSLGRFRDANHAGTRLQQYLDLQGPTWSYEIAYSTILVSDPSQPYLIEKLAFEANPGDDSQILSFSAYGSVDSIRNPGLFGGYSLKSGKDHTDASKEEEDKAQEAFDTHSQKALELCREGK